MQNNVISSSTFLFGRAHTWWKEQTLENSNTKSLQQRKKNSREMWMKQLNSFRFIFWFIWKGHKLVGIVVLTIITPLSNWLASTLRSRLAYSLWSLDPILLDSYISLLCDPIKLLRVMYRFGLIKHKLLKGWRKLIGLGSVSLSLYIENKCCIG